ncbi:MAG: PEP-CTERM sorting domain-containing protein [Thiobacillus sp.]|nr:PEP-CTERM sorting domain-containing protein [Thiobacillus sp.]
MKCVNKLAAGLFLLGHTLGGAAFAAPVTLTGNAVDFSFDDALLGLFGQANVSGDTLYFTPVGFKAQSLNGAGFALANDTMNIKMTARDGWSFAGLEVRERGDYLLLGTGSTADVGGQIRVFDVARPLTDLTASIGASAPLDLTGMPTHNWQANATLDLGDWNDAQAVNVTIQNLLLVSTGTASSLAFVEKKFVGLTPFMLAVTPVPEAQTYAMMLAGLGLVGGMAMRRRATSK